jgi:flagellar protein FlgJ
MADPIISLQSPPSAPTSVRKNTDAAKTAREFEGVFAGQIAKILMETAEIDSAFSGGQGEEMFRGILAEQIGNKIAQGKGLGIATEVEAQIIRMQGGDANAQ